MEHHIPGQPGQIQFSDLSVEDAKLRYLLWPLVNVLLPLDVFGANEDETELHLAHYAMYLPRVPVVGEVIGADKNNLVVESVNWTLDGRVAVFVKKKKGSLEALKSLEATGWDVGPYENEPPSDWLQPSSD